MNRLVAAAALLAASFSAAPGQAKDFYRDQAYADDYGNLVILSHSGFKRILVGQANRLGEFAAYQAEEEPAVVFDEPVATGRRHGFAHHGCWRPPVLVKGRSYMYGFDEGEIPLQGGPCR